MNNDDRSATIVIAGQEYKLFLTTKATKQIGKRYGGLENLGDKLMKSENFELALEEIIWLLALLANQNILIHNLQNPNDKKALITEEYLELLTSPYDLATYKNSIMEAMHNGTERHIKSEETEGKNAQVG
ncbi:MAG: hypothetical protein ACYCWE_20335 [Eubacteriales bacterium]